MNERLENKIPPELWIDEIDSMYNGQWILGKVTQYDVDNNTKPLKARVIARSVNEDDINEDNVPWPGWAGERVGILRHKAKILIPGRRFGPVTIDALNKLYEGKYRMTKKEIDGTTFTITEKVKVDQEEGSE